MNGSWRFYVSTVLLLLLIGLGLASTGRQRPHFSAVSLSAAEAPLTPTAIPPAPIDNPTSTLVCNIPAGNASLTPGCHLNILLDQKPAQDLPAVSDAPCADGLSAGTYPCHQIDLLSFMPLSELGGLNGNDVWGWTDASTSRDYALMGLTDGVAFVDISDPVNPVHLGNLPKHTGAANSPWRDIKVYANHAFIVADYAGVHGLQVFDLTQLRQVASPPVTFTETTHYNQFGSAHNLVINQESGFAYAVGVSSGDTACAGGLHIINIQEPANPVFAGCFSGDGYTHDAQCVNYAGPDEAYHGREICFNSNTDTLTIVDATDKSAPEMLARQGYSSAGYTHQGWLTPDQRYFLLDDEGDEKPTQANTRTYIWDVGNLGAPQLIGTYTAANQAIDHNQYLHNGYTFQANYQSGLRVLSLEHISEGHLYEVAFFDVYPEGNDPFFNGAWSNYPFFASGVIIVSGMEQGLFVLKMREIVPLSSHIYLPAIISR